ncbi:hypothetical protein NLG97_g1393 [Lecanicillium saksenae]|uniref:Uncharacterized protein n=1 Tax=Lecanicillium saksenae TaxID=468837 RepID=A0ACC1R6I5_9HYPO|nr:hypothetical protein NLG97_g1393 [Lecanicillium saksenae]
MLADTANMKDDNPSSFLTGNCGTVARAVTRRRHYLQINIAQSLVDAILKSFGKTAKTITLAKLGHVIRSKAITPTKKNPITEAVRSVGDSQEPDHLSFQSIINICTGIRRQMAEWPVLMKGPRCMHARSPFIRGGVVFNWLFSRYLEMTLFKYLQHSINGRDGTGNDKVKADAMTMVHILLSYDDLISMLDMFQLEESHVKEANARQNLVRNVLSRYCCIYASKLGSWSNFWEEVGRVWLPLHRNCHLESAQDGLPPFDSLRHHVRAGLEIVLRGGQHGRQQVMENLESLLNIFRERDAKHSKVLFSRYFLIMAYSRIIELRNEQVREPSRPQNVQRAGIQSPECTFQALSFLACLGNTVSARASSTESSGIEQHASEGDLKYTVQCSNYLSKQIIRRRILTSAYESAFESSEKHNSDLQQNFTTILLMYFVGEKEIYPTNSFEHGLCIARRWKELKDIAGDTILLCGGPFLVENLPYNIPTIVETGPDEEFASLKDAILGDCSWVRDTCVQLQAIDGIVDICAKQGKDIDWVKKLAPVHSILRYSPLVLVIGGELRRMGLGVPLQQVLGRVCNYEPGGICRKTMIICMEVITWAILVTEAESEVEFIAEAQVAIRTVLEKVPGAWNSRSEFYCQEILQSLWI